MNGIEMEDLTLIATIISISATIIGLLIQYFKGYTNLKERLVELETKMSLFWNMIQQAMPQLLKMPIHIRRDELLEKLSNNTISISELEELKCDLKNEYISEHSAQDPKALAAILIMGLMEQKIFDLRKVKK